MRLFDFTFSTPYENLACDEALLNYCEETSSGEVLRFWSPKQYFVVVGYANKVSTEVNVDFCQNNGIPILRRATGGGTVLQGPGCLNYALILDVRQSPMLQSIPGTNDYVLSRLESALAELLNAPVKKEGHTDLAIHGRKFCGNAQRRKKDYLIFHGCLLLNLDFDLVKQVLPLPSKQPAYRANREHTDFLMNLEFTAQPIKNAVATAWQAKEVIPHLSLERVRALVREKYTQDTWNFKF